MAKKSNTSPKKPKIDKWVNKTSEQYQKGISELVHFSSKTVNSNALGCGIRLGPKQFTDLPYAAVSTMQPGTIQCDYYTGANGAGAGVIKQLVGCLANEPLAEKYANPPKEEELHVIREAICKLDEPYVGGIGQVAIRLRQIIVQDAEGNDIALTPLQSSGFCHELENRLKAESEAMPKEQYFSRRRAYLGIGGANSQNVGRYVRDMQRPLWFSPPREDPEVRHAYAIHYKGVKLTPPVGPLQAYRDWRTKLMNRHEGKMVTDAELRQRETEMIREMVAAILKRAASAHELLMNNREYLPGESLTAEGMDRVMRGLLDPELRYRDWKHDLAEQIRREIVDYRDDREKISLGVGDEESLGWIDIIKEAL